MKPIDKLMDCQHVKRWTLVATTAESNVAGHSFNVAMIAMAIRNKMLHTNHFGSYELAFHALMHDVDEAETGDIPTPTKEAIRKAGVEPNALFETQSLGPKPPKEIAAIIKLADLIDNYVFIREHGAGARAWLAAGEVKTRLDEAIAGAPGDMGAAARWVLTYIINRGSETDEEERRRLTEDSERRRSVDNQCWASIPPIVD